MEQFHSLITGKTVYLVGSGTSVSAHDYSWLRDRSTMVLNSSVELFKNPTMLGWSDITWQLSNESVFYEHPNTLLCNFIMDGYVARMDLLPDHSKYNRIRIDQPDNYNHTKYEVNGNNTGSRALNFLCHFKPKNIVMIGFDLKGDNWHKMYQGTHDDYHHVFRKNFEAMAPDIKALGINVYNAATPEQSTLDCFERINIQEWKDNGY